VLGLIGAKPARRPDWLFPANQALSQLHRSVTAEKATKGAFSINDKVGRTSEKLCNQKDTTRI
jgi:hypothetical protein